MKGEGEMMSEKTTIAVIGAGIMGEAIIAGLLNKKIATPDQINISDPLKDRLEELKKQYGVNTFTENLPAVDQAATVIFAVKPQQVGKVTAALKNKISSDALVISIIAGASIGNISAGLNHNNIVRCMPNTPAQIGEGITVWYPSPSVSPQQVEWARQVIGALGQEVLVEEEYYLDMATALSGTGPAYVFLFMEVMIDAGVHLGFPRRIAEQLVVQTLKGSVDYYTTRKLHPATLRNQVTSPGGTSAEALYYLEKAGFRTAISRAIWAAYERSLELGKGKSAHQPEKKENNDPA
jgi:pyrroline-5-carboxylate reductase